MPRKKILWLCSWYPGKFSPFNGDFIQRHARAASLYNDIYVVHVYGTTENLEEKVVTERVEEDGLTEHRVYFRKSPGNRWWAGYQWLKLGKSAIRSYIELHGKPDLVHVHIPLKSGLLALWMKRKYGTDYIVSEHWGIYNDVVEDRFGRKSAAFRRLTKLILARSSAFLSVSRYLAKAVNDQVGSTDFTIIPNAVDTSLFRHVLVNGKITRFIHVSNMIPLKNAEGILHAFRLLLQKRQDVELLMTGDAPTNVRQLAADLGIASFVKFSGEVEYATVAAAMQSAHALVVFSDMENAPCVIGEALCCGLPVIASAVGGIPEMVKPHNSILVPPRDVDSLYVAMHQMADTYRAYDREAIAGEAADMFGYAQVGKQFDTTYASLLRKT